MKKLYTQVTVAKNTLISGEKGPVEKSWLRRLFSRKKDNRDINDVISLDSSGFSTKTSIRFTIYPADGGYVIEHYKYNRYQDSEGTVLTIVNHGDSIGTAVEHIISIEALRS